MPAAPPMSPLGPLDVVAVFNNPMGWMSRLKIWRRFEDAILATAGVRLTTVELEYGDRPFQLPPRPGVRRLWVRGGDVLWHKENLQRIGFAAIADWQYGAVVDGDLLFFDPHWALKTVHALQLAAVVQITSDLVFLGPDDQFIGRSSSFMSLYRDARRRHHCGRFYCPGSEPALDRHGYPGGAWAWRRAAYEAFGGPYDVSILGAGDMRMAYGFVGMPDPVTEDRDYSEHYRQSIRDWRHRAALGIKRNVGLVEGLVFHLWHGKSKDRQYSTRGQILIRNHYSPRTDIVRDHQGLIGWAGNKPRLRDDVSAYFAERNEDSRDL